MQRFIATLVVLVVTTGALAAERPNILWITCEDISPNLACYGDHYSVTPNLDGLAAKGMRYTNAISNAPVCAAARTTIITGLYPPSTGAEHMRSFVDLPATLRLFPQYLRDAGREKPVKALKDDSPIVRVVAAEALARFGSGDDTAAALKVLLKHCQPSEDAYLTTAAWNALDYLDGRASPAKEAIRAISPDPESPPQHYGGYGRALKNQTLKGLN
jgi:hypothetical protein